jgi:membrane protease YdiL (CAAX protease family)
MNTDPRPRPPTGFWRTVKLLLGAARRRGVGRKERQRELLHNRTGKRRDTLGQLGLIFTIFFMVVINSLAAFTVKFAVTAGQRIDAENNGKIVVREGFLDDARSFENRGREVSRYLISSEAKYHAEEVGGSKEEYENRLREALTGRRQDIIEEDGLAGLVGVRTTGAFPAMLGSIVLFWWIAMMICQGEGLELDFQRRRHPMWEWLFSHPVSPGAIFLAEMLSPIVANPIYLTGPFFLGFLYGFIYGPAQGAVAAILVGVPISVATACVGKAVEIAVMLRFPPRSRGAVVGLMSWFGYASLMIFLLGAFAMSKIVATAEVFLRPLAMFFPWPWLGWFVGANADSSSSLVLGMVNCWLAALAMIGGAVWFSIWGAQGGLAGNFAAKDLAPALTSAERRTRFGKDPLFRKEMLWFVRDRSAIVQTILIPMTIAGFQLFNLRGVIQRSAGAWNYLCGIAIVFGTYFLWVLGPKSLASEGQALWLALTWPRGLEGILKAKARLWTLIATGMVTLILAFTMFRFPQDAWKVLLVGIGWLAFGRSIAEKTVTLVTAPSSSGEPEKIPRGRQWAASLGMLTFGIGILMQQWHIAIMGIVYSWLTAAAMWENFRARIPFLFDPWSEKLPPPPTIMHAMIAVSALVEGGAVATGVVVFFVGTGKLAMAQALAYGICAVIVSIAVSMFLSGRGVGWREICYWQRTLEEKLRGRLVSSLATAALAGTVLGLFAHGYTLLLLQFPSTAEMIHKSAEQMAKVSDFRLWYGIMAVVFAPFAEEYLFRGLLYRALDREWGGWRAVIASAAFFAIYHPPLAWLPVFLLGITNAVLFKRSGRLAAAVLLHMIYNALVIL